MIVQDRFKQKCRKLVDGLYLESIETKQIVLILLIDNDFITLTKNYQKIIN